MAIEIYWISGSAPAWRVLLTLELKGLEYASHVLQTSKKEQKEPWFLKLNPRGQVPVLKDGDVVVTESLAIMHYLEAAYPEPPLFGDNPNHTANIEQVVHESLAYTDKAIDGFVQPVFRNKIDEASAGIPAVAEKIRQELSLMEQRLASAKWLCGDTISAADIVLIPTFQRLLRASGRAPGLAQQLELGSLGTTFANLVAWNKRVESLPAFEHTFPPHWRPRSPPPTS
jgi:glutathione S-transferase